MYGTRAALYCRLSKDDEQQGDSESIKTQKALLSQYCHENGLVIAGVYVDDGWSGLYFDRPDFQRMISDVEADKIDVVITKDLSRLGRDHLQVGHYTEIYFPMKNVRYIAINDNVDTAKKNNDIAAIKNVMNEFYSRDNSRKIKASIRARAKAGLYRSTFAPIGYKKSPDNKNKLVIDEDTAWIVRKIFQLVLEGKGAHAICTIFREEKVPCPSWFQHERGEKDYSKRFADPENKYEWTHTVILGIISNPVYIGSVVMCKEETVFKAGKCKKVPEQEQVRVDGVHDPIISQEDFEAANQLVKSRKREDCSGNVSIFAGLIKCGDCGKSMNQRYWTKKGHLKIFVCSRYATNTKACTDHRIFYDDLYDAVLNDIRCHAQLAFNDKERCIALAKKSLSDSDTGTLAWTEKQLGQAKKRYDNVTRMFDKMYEDSLEGRLTAYNFDRLSKKYQAEQDELLAKIQELENVLKGVKNAEENAVRWTEEMARLVDIQELTAELLNRYIEKIEVFSRKEMEGEVKQQIKITYRFGGYISAPTFSAWRYVHPSGNEWRLARGIA